MAGLTSLQKFVEGRHLNQWRDEERPTPQQAAEVCAKIARILAYAHDRDVVHRDIKPGNIIVDGTGTPHIIDFGLARHHHEDFRSGQMVGTPAYMSPEQAQGDLSDHRGDIYSVGTVLYELVADQRPFVTNDVGELLRQLVEQPPPRPGKFVPGLPFELEEICLRCLQKEPHERYESAHELADALDRFILSTAESGLAQAEAEDYGTLLEINARLKSQLEERSRMLFAIKAEYDLYHSLVESLPLCVYRKELDGRFVFANEFFCRAFGDPVNRFSADLFSEHVAELHAREERRVVETAKVIPSTENHGAGDQATNFEVLRSPVRNLLGEIVGVQGLMWDISSHTKVEKALRDARDAAERANRSKSVFLASMSHELRTPLSVVLGHVQLLLQNQGFDRDIRRNLGTIHGCSQQLLAMINDLLDLAKIESGNFAIEHQPTDLIDLVREVSTIMAARAEEKVIEFKLEHSILLPRWIQIDGNRLRQILVNLVGNAVKFTHEGSVRLILKPSQLPTTDLTAEPELYLQLEVIDTGIGIEPARQEEVLKPFAQLQPGIDAGGTGLGLSITQQLVKLMEGNLQLQSVPGEGSTFTVWLPLREAEMEEQLLRSHQPDNAPSYHLPPGVQRRILVVDDVASNRELLEQILVPSGLEVISVESAATAFATMQEMEFDLVLLDVRMPNMNGVEAIAHIRANPEWQQTKVIAVTASVFRDEQEQIINAGFDDFLGKPFDTARLFSKLADQLDVEFAGAHLASTNVAADGSGALQDGQAPDNRTVYLDLVLQMHAAITHGDVGRLRNLAEQLARLPGRQELGQQVLELAGNFQLDRISKLLSDVEGTD